MPVVRLHLLSATAPVPTDPKPWFRYARELAGVGGRAAGLYNAAIALAAQSKPGEAVLLDLEAGALGDDGGIAWNGLRHALLAGQRVQALRFAVSFREAWEGSGGARRAAFERLANHVAWNAIMTRSPSAFAEVVQCLPAELAEIVGASL